LDGTAKRRENSCTTGCGRNSELIINKNNILKCFTISAALCMLYSTAVAVRAVDKVNNIDQGSRKEHMYLKVKVPPLQANKALRVSRGIALLYLRTRH
jgi:hypothetical protein